jgi:hypothetical protein
MAKRQLDSAMSFGMRIPGQQLPFQRHHETISILDGDQIFRKPSAPLKKDPPCRFAKV